MKVLITYDSMHDEVTGALNLRNTDYSVDELMNVYETLEPELIPWLRETIVSEAPDAIIAVGKSSEYRWIGTIVCRVFGQFNSWNGQRRNAYGVTQLKIADKLVKVVAIDTVTDLELAQRIIEG